MITNTAVNEGFEISPRFRRTVEDRIARLERDAEQDEAQVAFLENADHIRRQMRLLAMERARGYGKSLYTGVFYRNPSPTPTYESQVRTLQQACHNS